MRYDMIYKHADLYLKIGRALKALLRDGGSNPSKT